MIQNEVQKRPQEARVGGIPSVQNKVRGYINLLYCRNGQWITPSLEIVNNTPVWALIFYLIRSGHLQEAVDFTLKNDSMFQKVERHFPAYLKAYASSPQRRLPQQLHTRLHTEFNQRIRFANEDSDPYKHAVYKILGRCDLSRRSLPEILPLAEDWMWLQLILCRESETSEVAAFEQFSLANLRRTLLQFGPSHFNPKGNNPGPYFQFLAMVGLFERCVHYMYQFQPMDSVHYAIALSYYGLLRVSGEGHEDVLLHYDESDNAEISFARLIGLYTRGFRATNSEEAFDYISTICLNDHELGEPGRQTELCHETVRELLLQSRDLSQLLGDVRSDGSRQPGIIEKKMKLIRIDNEQDFLRRITEQSAMLADDEGRVADAILLYHLSEEYDTVVAMINKSLGEALTAELTSINFINQPAAPNANVSLTAAENPAQLAQNMMAIYSNNASVYASVSPHNREACGVLLRVLEARKFYESQQWESCLSAIEAMDVIPLESHADVGSVRRRAQNFTALEENVARCVPTLLLMSIESCAHASSFLKQSSFGDSGRVQKLGELRGRAKSAMLYAGMIQYKMPAEVYSKLTRLEILL